MSNHQRVAELLPWYVNGSLGEVEMTLVEDHLRKCTTCNEDLAREMNIARRIQPAGGDESRLELLLAGQASAFSELRDSLPVVERLRWPAALISGGVTAAAIVIAVAIGFWIDTPAREQVFEPMTRSPQSIYRVDSDAFLVQLAFLPTTPEREIRRLLRASGGRLFGNPSATGIYRIVVAESDAQEVVERLRRQPAVRWIEVEQ